MQFKTENLFEQLSRFVRKRLMRESTSVALRARTIRVEEFAWPVIVVIETAGPFFTEANHVELAQLRFLLWYEFVVERTFGALKIHQR